MTTETHQRQAGQGAVEMALLDGEQRRITELLAQLRDALETGRDLTSIAEMFEELVELGRLQFRHEEESLRTRGYPWVVSHQAEHQALLELAFRMRDHFHQRCEDARHVALTFLSEWKEHDAREGHG